MNGPRFGKDDIPHVGSSCDNCGRGGTVKLTKPLLICSSCRQAAYCDAACQRKDWKNHSGACKRNSHGLEAMEKLSLSHPVLASLSRELSVFVPDVDDDIIYAMRSAMRLGKPDALDRTHFFLCRWIYDPRAGAGADEIYKRFTLASAFPVSFKEEMERIPEHYKPSLRRITPENVPIRPHLFEPGTVDAFAIGVVHEAMIGNDPSTLQRIHIPVVISPSHRFLVFDDIPWVQRPINPKWIDNFRWAAAQHPNRPMRVVLNEDLMLSEGDKRPWWWSAIKTDMKMRIAKGYMGLGDRSMGSGREGVFRRDINPKVLELLDEPDTEPNLNPQIFLPHPALQSPPRFIPGTTTIDVDPFGLD